MRRPRLLILWLVAILLGCAYLPAQNGPEPLKFPVGTLAMRKLKTAQAAYPEQARQKHIQGTVSFRALIGTNGTVERLTPIDGPPELVHAAEAAVKQWTYEPYLVEGQPRAVQTILQINFSFAGERDPGPAWMQEYRRATPFDMAGHLRTMVDPTRSPGRASHGMVRLIIVVGADGKVEQAEPTQGPADLCELARSAVAQWTYTPYLIQGKPAAVVTHIVFDFE